jgi:anti-sigma B factor antagonist
MFTDRRHHFTSPTFSYEVSTDDGQAVVHLSGELDMASAADLSACVDQLHNDDAPTVVIDLSHLDFCDSSGLRVLLTCRQNAEARGARLVLRSPPPAVRQLFELTNTDTLLGIDDAPSP